RRRRPALPQAAWRRRAGPRRCGHPRWRPRRAPRGPGARGKPASRCRSTCAGPPHGPERASRQAGKTRPGSSSKLRSIMPPPSTHGTAPHGFGEAPEYNRRFFPRLRMTSSWMLVAGLLFATMGVFVKIGAAQFGAAELAFYRSLVTFLMIAGVVVIRRQTVRTPHFGMHLMRAVV